MPSPDDTAIALGDGSSGEQVPDVAAERTLIEVRNRAARGSFDSATEDAISKFLEPFADAFGRLHDVTIKELATREVAQELEEVDVAVLHDATAMVEAFVDGGTSRDVAAQILRGALSISTHPIFRNAKSIPRKMPPRLAGRAVKLLDDARARLPEYAARANTFLAHSRGTVSRNKRTLVIAGAVAGAGALIAWAVKADKDDRDKKLALLRQQQLDNVAAHQADLRDDLDHRRLLFATERTEEATQTLGYLIGVGLTRLPDLEALVSGNDNFATYAPAERRVAAELVALAQTIASVIASTRRTNVAHDEHDTDAQTATLHAAREILSRYAGDQNTRTPGAGTAIAAATAATLNTATNRSQLTYLLQQRLYIERLATRCANVHDGIRAGFFFELLHTVGFNLNAIAQDSDLRAEMTERLGRPHDPVDIEMTDSNGDVVCRAQAKVVDSKYHRIGLKNGIADAKYNGQLRLIPADQLAETHAALDKALERSPENIYTTNYQDAKEHVTDVISAAGIASDPLTTGEINKAASDPASFINKVLSDNRRDQAITAGLTGGTTAALSAFATEISTHVLAEGNLDGREWTSASIAAARTGVTAAFATSASSYLQTGGMQAVHDGTASALQTSLALGDHGPALTHGAVKIAAIVHGVATDQLTPTEAAIATAETITQSAAIWACTYAARKTIRDPETAAIVAGIAGQVASQFISQGIQIALLGRDPNPKWDAAYEALLVDTAALERDYAVEREELAALTMHARARFAQQVQPALERLNTDSNHPGDAFADLLAVADHFGGVTLFASLDEFDEFMADPATALLLDLH